MFFHLGITISKFGISDLWWNEKNTVKSKQLPSVQTTNERFVLSNQNDTFEMLS